MGPFILKRLVQSLLTILVVTLVVFLSVQATGDPAALLAPLDAKPSEVEALRVKLGLDRPLYIQYLSFLSQALRGDMGVSFRFQQPTMPLILLHLSHSLQLGIPSIFLACLIAIPLGMLAAIRRGTIYDALILAGALIGQATPVFLLSILLIWIFAVNLRWFPASGTDSLAHYVLPITSIVVFYLAVLVRMTRSSMLEVLGTDYMRTARAKGLTESLVLLKHALRNAGISIVSLIGLQIGNVLSGMLVVETIFAWPGLGKLMYDAVLQRDIPLVMAGATSIAVMVALLNLGIDLTYAVMDPRIRYE
jgi:peptide/nickel transport system permease protein